MTTTPKPRFTATVHAVKEHPGWFDYRIWRDGMLIQSASGTMFDTRTKARAAANYRLTEWRAANN